MFHLLNLPLPVPVNRQWRQGRGGTYLSAEARKKRTAIIAAIHEQTGGGPPLEPMTGPVQVAIAWTPRDQRIADVDAYIKGALDAITHAGLWLDDSQVYQVTCERMPTPRFPGHWDCEIWEVAS
jgi:crossover junction endodeoxyribonuclease RusA